MTTWLGSSTSGLLEQASARESSLFFLANQVARG
jgi:hypothetical protein